MKLCIRLTALLMLCASHWVAYAAPVSSPSVSKSDAQPAAFVKPQWDHQGHIRFCAQRGAKNCPTVTIPPGINRIKGIISTHQIPGVPHGFVIINGKGHSSINAYLCATGVDSPSKLRCQRMALPDPALGSIDDEAAKAIFQNTVSVLLNPRTRATRVSSPRMNAMGGGCFYDEETGDDECYDGDEDGGSDGPSSEDPGSYGDIPDPAGDSNWGSAEDLAAPFLDEILAEIAFDVANSGKYFRNVSAQCNIGIGRCREDCGDRGAQQIGACAVLGGVIALIPNALARAAGIFFAGACAYDASNYMQACKAQCLTICE